MCSFFSYLNEQKKNTKKAKTKKEKKNSPYKMRQNENGIREQKYYVNNCLEF